jgi:hypothetical protein
MPARLCLLLAVALTATVTATAPASAAGWRCDASALDAGGVAPVVAGGLDRECAAQTSGSAALAEPLSGGLAA